MDDKNLYSYCHVAECTDVGCKRKANEDFLGHFVCVNGLVSVVCDGMGGHVGGAVASHIAVEAIRNFLCETFIDDPKVAISKAMDVANEAILERAATQPELTGMGSTCVMLIVRDGKVYIGSVGDSRIYLVRERKIRQLTKDQSYVQMLVDRGELTPEEAENHPRKNEITNALGIPEMRPATVLPDAISPEAGDCFLLCSDGLSGMVSDKEIQRIVSKQTEMGSQERAEMLVEIARRNGGLDNITVQLVEFAITPEIGGQKPRKRVALFVCLAIVVLGMLIGAYSLLKQAHSQEKKEAVSRVDTLIYLGELSFHKETEILKITKDALSKSILIQLSGNNEDIKIRKMLSLDSLVILSKDTIKREQIGNNNNCIALKFSQIFKADSLVFELKDNVTVYRFTLYIKPQQESETAALAVGKSSGVPSSTPRGVDDIIGDDFGITSKGKKNKASSKTAEPTDKTKENLSGYTVNVLYDESKPLFLTVIFGKEGNNGNNQFYLPQKTFKNAECDPPITLNLDGNNQELTFSFSSKPASNHFSIKIMTNEGVEVIFNVNVKFNNSK